MGRIYPSLTRIREVSARIAAAVAEVAFRDGLVGVEKPASVLELLKSQRWEPRCESPIA